MAGARDGHTNLVDRRDGLVSAFVMHSCVATSAGLPAAQLFAGILPLNSRVMQFW